MREAYIIIAWTKDDEMDFSESPSGHWELATRRVFATKVQAEARASSYHPSHKPIVVLCPKGANMRTDD